MSKIDLIEECENEEEKYKLYLKVNCKKLIVNLCIVLFTFILITTFPKKILDLMPDILSDLKFLVHVFLPWGS